MSFVPLVLAKAHLAVIHDLDDELIQQNLDAAEEACADYMNREGIAKEQSRPWKRGPFDPCRDRWRNSAYCEEVAPTTYTQEVPRAVVQAILLTVGDMYENRTTGVVGTTVGINPTTRALLDPYRIWLGV
jgi:hypothetical protein